MRRLNRSDLYEKFKKNSARGTSSARIPIKLRKKHKVNVNTKIISPEVICLGTKKSGKNVLNSIIDLDNDDVCNNAVDDVDDNDDDISVIFSGKTSDRKEYEVLTIDDDNYAMDCNLMLSKPASKPLESHVTPIIDIDFQFSKKCLFSERKSVSSQDQLSYSISEASESKSTSNQSSTEVVSKSSSAAIASSSEPIVTSSPSHPVFDEAPYCNNSMETDLPQNYSSMKNLGSSFKPYKRLHNFSGTKILEYLNEKTDVSSHFDGNKPISSLEPSLLQSESCCLKMTNESTSKDSSYSAGTASEHHASSSPHEKPQTSNSGSTGNSVPIKSLSLNDEVSPVEIIETMKTCRKEEIHKTSNDSLLEHRASSSIPHEKPQTSNSGNTGNSVPIKFLSLNDEVSPVEIIETMKTCRKEEIHKTSNDSLLEHRASSFIPYEKPQTSNSGNSIPLKSLSLNDEVLPVEMIKTMKTCRKEEVQKISNDPLTQHSFTADSHSRNLISASLQRSYCASGFKNDNISAKFNKIKSNPVLEKNNCSFSLEKELLNSKRTGAVHNRISNFFPSDVERFSIKKTRVEDKNNFSTNYEKIIDPGNVPLSLNFNFHKALGNPKSLNLSENLHKAYYDKFKNNLRTKSRKLGVETLNNFLPTRSKSKLWKKKKFKLKKGAKKAKNKLNNELNKGKKKLRKDKKKVVDHITPLKSFQGFKTLHQLERKLSDGTSAGVKKKKKKKMNINSLLRESYDRAVERGNRKCSMFDDEKLRIDPRNFHNKYNQYSENDDLPTCSNSFRKKLGSENLSNYFIPQEPIKSSSSFKNTNDCLEENVIPVNFEESWPSKNISSCSNKLSSVNLFNSRSGQIDQNILNLNIDETLSSRVEPRNDRHVPSGNLPEMIDAELTFIDNSEIKKSCSSTNPKMHVSIKNPSVLSKEKLKTLPVSSASSESNTSDKNLFSISSQVLSSSADKLPPNKKSDRVLRADLVKLNTNVIDISDDEGSVTSEQSFIVDVGTNVYVPGGVSFKGPRPIIIDGSNVAFGHGISTRGQRVFSSKGIEICVKFFVNRCHKVIVFVPLFRRWCPSTMNPEILQKLSNKGLVTYTPSRKINSRLSVPYDDRYIVQCAVALGGIIVSTDNYRDLLRENPTWKSTIEKRLLMFTFVGDMLMFPQDPLGRRGPKLDEFLQFPK